MARQSGVIKFTGTLADLSGYKDGKGGHILRTKGGATAEQIANGENFARTRENNAEFGAVAKVGKFIRDALATTKGSWDTYVTGRLVKLLKQINLLDESEKRGQRAVLLTASPSRLLNFQFNAGSNVDSVIRVPYTVTPNADRNKVVWALPAMTPGVQLAFPTGATHARFILAAVAISDYSYDADTSEYAQLVDVVKENAIVYSDYLDLSEPIDATTVTATLPTEDPLPADATLISVIGVQFYQEVGAEFYPFAQKDALKIGAAV